MALVITKVMVMRPNLKRLWQEEQPGAVMTCIVITLWCARNNFYVSLGLQQVAKESKD